VKNTFRPVQSDKGNFWAESRPWCAAPEKKIKIHRKEDKRKKEGGKGFLGGELQTKNPSKLKGWQRFWWLKTNKKKSKIEGTRPGEEPFAMAKLAS